MSYWTRFTMPGVMTATFCYLLAPAMSSVPALIFITYLLNAVTGEWRPRPWLTVCGW